MAYHQVAHVFREGTLTGLSDREILDRYVDRRDEAAFEAIVGRHGPMVLNVCRQLLRDSHDVEDAFQATFLALIRKADSIRVDDSMGPWLHTVANRIAARARANRLRQGIREPFQELLPEPSATDRPDCLETPRIIQEELGRLPDRLRIPVVLCYMQGITHELAASQIGCPVGTVHSRLARARTILHQRLIRRGLTLSAGAVAALLESSAKAGTVPLHLRKSLIMVATRSFTATAATSAVGLGVSASAVALLEGVLNLMRIKTLTMAAAALAAMGILLAVVGTTAYSVAGPPDEQPASTLKTDGRLDPSPEKEAPETFPRTYAVGDLITPPQVPAPKQAPGVGQAPGTWPEIPDVSKVDMIPLMKLITSTVDPGSWRLFDDQGQDISAKVIRGSRNPTQNATEPIGSITPFYLSMSLIVRATGETHEKVAILLRGLRALSAARDNPGAIPEEEEDRFLMSTNPRDATQSKSQFSPTSAKTPPGPKRPGSRAKINQLMDQLRQEIAKLPDDPGE